VLNSRDELATSLAYSEAVRLALESEALHDDLDTFNELSALLAVRSLRTTYTLQGDAALLGAGWLNHPVARLQVEGFAWAYWMASAPDGSQIATVHQDAFNPRIAASELWLWDAQTFEPILKVEGDLPYVWPAIYTADSRYVVAAVGKLLYAGDPLVIHMWDTSTGQIYRQFLLGTDRLWEMVSVSANGSEVYAVVLDQNDRYAIRYWDVETGADLRRVELPFTGRVEELIDEPQTRVFVSRPQPDFPDEMALITFPDASPELWDARRGVRIRSLDGGMGFVQSALFSPSQRRIAMSVSNGTVADSGFEIQVLDTLTGERVQSIEGVGGAGLLVDQYAFSRDERFMFVGSPGNGRITSLWDLETGRSIRTWDATFAQGTLSPDDKWIILSHSDQDRVEVYAMSETSPPQRLPHPERVRGVAYSHDGRWIASAGGDSLIRLWDARVFEEVRQFAGHVLPVTEVRFSPDDRYILSTGWNDDYRLWDVHTGELIWQYGIGSINRMTPAFTSDGRYIIAFNTDDDLLKQSISVVEIATNSVVAEIALADSTGLVNCAKFSPDDRYVMITKGSDWLHSYLWDWRSGSPAVEIRNEANVAARCGTFTQDSQQLILAGNDGILRIYDVQSGVEVRRFAGLPNQYIEVAMSPDGVYVLGTGSNEVRVWEFATGREVRRYIFPGVIWGAAYSPDGSRIAFGSFDGDGVYIVQTDIEAEIRALCARLSRDFTADERAQFNIDDDEPTCPTL
jgi:WD40 repeat protein